MGLIKAKCSNCGANLNIDNHSKTGICDHCGASYITEDVIINNITNINYNETINGVNLKRQAVLENLLIKYYSGEFNDVDNIKEYALKVQEYDLNNPLAHFVVFDKIDSTTSIKNFLSSTDLNISLDLFILLLDVCGDDLNQNKIINNIVKYKSQMNSSELFKEIVNKCRKKDYDFFLNIIYNLKLSEKENDIFLDELYNNQKTSKITFLSRLKLFKVQHNDFMYDEQKFSGYAEYWKSLKEKQMSNRENLTKKEDTPKTVEDLPLERKQNSKKKTIFLCLGFSIALILLIIVGIFIL